MRELEINLVLTFRVPEDGLTVNGILQGLEEQTPVIFNTLLKNMFKALEAVFVKIVVALTDPIRHFSSHRGKPFLYALKGSE